MLKNTHKKNYNQSAERKNVAKYVIIISFKKDLYIETLIKVFKTKQNSNFEHRDNKYQFYTCSGNI